jgi:hypothetical protein
MALAVARVVQQIKPTSLKKPLEQSSYSQTYSNLSNRFRTNRNVMAGSSGGFARASDPYDEGERAMKGQQW